VNIYSTNKLNEQNQAFKSKLNDQQIINDKLTEDYRSLKMKMNELKQTFNSMMNQQQHIHRSEIQLSAESIVSTASLVDYGIKALKWVGGGLWSYLFS